MVKHAESQRKPDGDYDILLPEGVERFDELRSVLPALQLFGDIADADVAPDSLVREFIGGGIYEY